MPPRDDALTVYLNTRHDAHLLDDCLTPLRRHWPRAAVIIRADGDDDPALDAIAARHGAELARGPRLFVLAEGGRVVDEMLRLYLRRPTPYLLKIDPDTRVRRAFWRLPAVDCVFGTVQQNGGLYSIQGGCVGFTRGSAERMHHSGAARDPALTRDPPPWAINAALRSRPARGLTSVDWVVGWAARALGIPLVDWPEILSEWTADPDAAGGDFAVTHPHKPTPAGGSTTSVRRYAPERLVPGPGADMWQAPLDSPLDSPLDAGPPQSA